MSETEESNFIPLAYFGCQCSLLQIHLFNIRSYMEQCIRLTDVRNAYHDCTGEILKCLLYPLI